MDNVFINVCVLMVLMYNAYVPGVLGISIKYAVKCNSTTKLLE